MGRQLILRFEGPPGEMLQAIEAVFIQVYQGTAGAASALAVLKVVTQAIETSVAKRTDLTTLRRIVEERAAQYRFSEHKVEEA